MTSSIRNVIIIGSGPAGHTAGIYAARANLMPLMFEGNVKGGIPGGQLMITNDVENYPGFPAKITGPDLMKAFRDQSVHQGVEIRGEDVNKVDVSAHPFKVWAGDDDVMVESKTLIIATGAQAKWLDIESEHSLKGRGVSACAVCDGAFFRNQDVAVVGGVPVVHGAIGRRRKRARQVVGARGAVALARDRASRHRRHRGHPREKITTAARNIDGAGIGGEEQRLHRMQHDAASVPGESI